MFTIDLKTDLTVCEKIYLLCWTVPKKMMVLLAFSYFPTYSESVLLLNSPLQCVEVSLAQQVFNQMSMAARPAWY